MNDRHLVNILFSFNLAAHHPTHNYPLNDYPAILNAMCSTLVFIGFCLTGHNPPADSFTQSLQQSFQFGLAMLQPRHPVPQLFQIPSQVAHLLP